MSVHHKLSPSAADIWVNCPASVLQQEGLIDASRFVDNDKDYAEEGTEAHTLAAKWLEQGRPVNTTLAVNVTTECAILEYINYIKQLQCDKYPLIVETKVNYGFGAGTLDAAVITPTEIHIVDFKFGVGNRIHAYENYQLLLYALGVVELIGSRSKIVLHIVQPRIVHFDQWEITIEQLREWGEFFKEAAKLTEDTNAKFKIGKHCNFCKAKATCPAFKTAFKLISKEEIADTKYILDNAAAIKNYIKTVEDEAYKTLIRGGVIDGYKLVKSKGRRKYNSTAEQFLIDNLGDGAFTKSLIGVTEASKKLGKKVIDGICDYEDGNNKMVSIDDPRDDVSEQYFFDEQDD